MSPTVMVVVGLVIGLTLGLLVAWWQRRSRQEVEAALDEAEVELHRRVEQEKEHWRRNLVDALGSPALLFDGDQVLVLANRSARELLRIREGVPSLSALQALGSVALAEAVAAVANGESHALDLELGDRHVHAVVTAIGGDTIVVITDQTRERRVEELRRDFVVNASHELKTPATAIQTLSEALEITAQQDPARVPDLVFRLREESDRLVRLVHDLLSLRRLEDRPAVEPVRFDLAETLRDILADLDERARARGLELSLTVPESAMIAAEPDDVRLIARNLVANAIQYNQEGGDVRITLIRDDEAWLLEVADTGIGIPQADLPRIFERFYRVDVARSRQTGGTGLGLSIVRHAVERHGGTIDVESLLGQGTTFRVRLPIDAV